ncbi:MAG TPA: EAL domain-containing protein, partial [Thermomicrobiales bacterium]|nr:EAL domain-containing protein [Thermomicrobiales bacterium]
DPTIQTLMVCNAVGYGVGISARNAGRPAIAIGQLMLAVAPVTVALVVSGGAAHLVLAGSMVMLLPAMISIILTTFGIVRKSIHAAETSARLAERMKLLARSDAVTGLCNRAGLNYHLEQRLRDYDDKRGLALFWFDLDRFKEVNDTLGHPVGDAVLSEVAARLRAHSPTGAAIAQFGGDEFIMICDGAKRRQLEAAARALLQAITQPMTINGERLQVGTSIGIACMPRDGKDIETLMQSADLALYRSKTNGRNRFSFFEPSLTSELVRRREIEAELRAAILNEELTIAYQPIVDIANGRIRAFEALVRWHHPVKGEMRPDEFIPVAEETGVIITLGNWVTSRAARAAAAWPEEITLNVNLSPLQIRAPGAALGILRAIRDAGLPAERLQLEVTESVLLENDHATEQFMVQLRSAGVRFALDDFGTGYSSLASLHRYPFSTIKIDRSFVSGVNAGHKSDAIIRAVAGMATQLHMDIVAEGLETLEQAQAVQAAGCTLGQGYYFSLPIAASAALSLLEAEQTGAPERRVAG